jgi:hypothetical protein
MGFRSPTRALRVALLLLLTAGCHLPRSAESAQSQAPSTPSWLANTLRAPTVEVARAAAPPVPPASKAPAVPPPLPAAKAADALTSTSPPPIKNEAKPTAAVTPPPDDLGNQWVAAGTLRAVGSPALHPPVLFREQETPPPALPKAGLPPVTEPPGSPPARPASAAAPVDPPPSARGVPPGEFLPPIPALPDQPLPQPVKPKSLVPPPTRPSDTPPPPPAPAPLGPPVALPPPNPLPPMNLPPQLPGPGPIEIDGSPVPFESLSKMVDGNTCSNCGSGLTPGGFAGCESCGACGPAQCRAGGKRCEPFPAHGPFGRVIGLIYSSICCPDPCYQPRWEPLADAAFFVDAVRPKTATKVRWDYGTHFQYPDRGEYFFARGDGNGRGPKANPPLLGIPYVDYHELMLITEVATGAAGVQIAVPYRSVNATPYGQDGAGFSDLQITAKTLLLDSELFLFGFQMRTYIPIGQTGKGLGTGHTSLEPALNFGLRLAPKTYLQSQVLEWIPLGGDKDYSGAHLRWAMSVNHIWWQPVKDVRLIGTLETTGISFQDGLYTDPALGTLPLARKTIAHIGGGLRLFFCDTLDVGLGWQHGITGFYTVRDLTRFEIRYRY